MFWRKPKGEGAANRLSDEAEPNMLSWDADGGLEAELDKGDEVDDEVDEDKDDPEVAARRAAELAAELQREAEEFGLTGSNAAEIYGPNGEAVASLLDSMSEVDYETAEAIADAYEAIPEAERKVARSVVRRRHRGGGLDADLWAAEHAVSDWLAAMQLEGDEAALYGVVADAATDAVDALVLEDDLADVDFATLYGPWSDVMDADDDDGAGDDAGDGAGDDEAEPANGSGSAETTSAEEGAEADGEFGPNTELVLQFLTKLAALTAAETSELVTAWRRQPKEELRIAHRDLQALADEDRRWREQLRLAQEEVFAWMSGRSDKRDYSFGAPQSLARVREPAGPAVADAVAAIAMADMLEPKDTETLYAPWAEVVKEPALPQYEEDEGDEAK
jgi:hypothetical protein